MCSSADTRLVEHGDAEHGRVVAPRDGHVLDAPHALRHVPHLRRPVVVLEAARMVSRLAAGRAVQAQDHCEAHLAAVVEHAGDVVLCRTIVRPRATDPRSLALIRTCEG